MPVLLSILLAAFSFFAGLCLGKSRAIPSKCKANAKALPCEEYKSFLSYDGSIQ